MRERAGRKFPVKSVFLVSLGPVFPDFVFPGDRAAERKVLPCPFYGLHEKLSHLFGLVGPGQELGFVMDVQHLDVVPA